MNTQPTPRQLPFPEFVALIASMISLVALSIDAMLPALAEMGSDLGVAQANDSQLVISMIFLGMAFGQMLYGPMSDINGRKPAIYLGYGFFLAGSLLALVTDDFTTMIAGRFLQGFGLAAPRVITLAIVRDLYSGRAMARVMSFVMMVFIMVPMIAPAVGQGILLGFGWRAIFTFILLFGLVTAIWFLLRQPESLPLERRVAFSIKGITKNIGEVLGHPVAFGYTLVTGIVFSAFVGYLNSAQQLFQQQYGLGHRFPLYFALLASAIGLASFINGRLVMRVGMQRPARAALIVLLVSSAACLGLLLSLPQNPPLPWLTIYFLIAFLCIGVLFGNLNALAMEPLGHIAGIGAAIVGSVSMMLSVPLGIFIGRSFNGTPLPLVAGFTLCAAAALLLVLLIERRRETG